MRFLLFGENLLSRLPKQDTKKRESIAISVCSYRRPSQPTRPNTIGSRSVVVCAPTSSRNDEENDVTCKKNISAKQKQKQRSKSANIHAYLNVRGADSNPTDLFLCCRGIVQRRHAHNRYPGARGNFVHKVAVKDHDDVAWHFSGRHDLWAFLRRCSRHLVGRI